MARVLVSDPIAQEAVELLRKTLEVDVRTGLSADELKHCIKDYQALVVRSQTKVTREVVEAATSLSVIGRAGVGVDNIDVAAATQRGILVINSPQGNTISAAEHTMALLLAAARRLPEAHASMTAGKWDRKSFTGNELYNKTLGVVGFGRIGREVASRAQSFKMRVLAYDPFVSAEFTGEAGAEPVDLETLLERSDFVTIHVPKTDKTSNLFDASRLASMKRGSFLLNCARGGVVDEGALAEAVASGHLAGAALDVYAQEPPESGNPVVGHPRIVHTPHLAASTVEAQQRVAFDVAEQIVQVLRGEPPRSAVNITYVPPKVLAFLRPYMGLAEKMGRFLSDLVEGAVRRVRVTYRGELAESEVSFVTRAALKGVLDAETPDTVNFVNAVLVAKERGIEVVESRAGKSSIYSSLIELELETNQGKRTASGAVFEDDQPRIVLLEGLRLSVVLSGVKLVSWQTDQPGVVGQVGTVLGQQDINIAEMQVGRRDPRTHAVMVMSVDERPSPETLAAIDRLPGIERARLVCL